MWANQKGVLPKSNVVGRAVLCTPWIANQRVEIIDVAR